MKKFIVFLFLASGLFISNVLNSGEPPSYEHRVRICMTEIESLVDEAKVSVWSFDANNYAWIQTTTPNKATYFVELRCQNDDIGDDYMRSHMTIANPYSYQLALQGYWGGQVWFDEYKNPENKYDLWTFRGAFARYYSPEEEAIVIFISYSDDENFIYM